MVEASRLALTHSLVQSRSLCSNSDYPSIHMPGSDCRPGAMITPSPPGLIIRMGNNRYPRSPSPWSEGHAIEGSIYQCLSVAGQVRSDRLSPAGCGQKAGGGYSSQVLHKQERTSVEETATLGPGHGGRAAHPEILNSTEPTPKSHRETPTRRAWFGLGSGIRDKPLVIGVKADSGHLLATANSPSTPCECVA